MLLANARRSVDVKSEKSWKSPARRRWESEYEIEIPWNLKKKKNQKSQLGVNLHAHVQH